MEMISKECLYEIDDSLRNASAIDESFLNMDLQNKKISNPLVAEAIKA